MSQKKANLARIRDNQRRSRARQKEYLQELEARLRQYELQGIEATSEIQMAARRVADENKRLRGLLAQHGVGDDSIEAFFQSSAIKGPDAIIRGQFGAGSDSGAVQVLEHLRSTRKQCYANGSTDAPTTTAMRGGCRSQSSIAMISTVQSLWEPIHPSQNQHGRRRSENIHPMSKSASSSHPVLTPGSTSSRTCGVSLGHSAGRGVQQHQRLASVALSLNMSPASNPSRDTLQMCNFDDQLSLSHQSSLEGFSGTDCEVDNNLVFNVVAGSR